MHKYIELFSENLTFGQRNFEKKRKNYFITAIYTIA